MGYTGLEHIRAALGGVASGPRMRSREVHVAMAGGHRRIEQVDLIAYVLDVKKAMPYFQREGRKLKSPKPNQSFGAVAVISRALRASKIPVNCSCNSTRLNLGLKSINLVLLYIALIYRLYNL